MSGIVLRLTDQVENSGGKPIVNGYYYIGKYQQDPVANPLSLFSDPGLTTPIANPQRTDSFGRLVSDIYVAESRYSYQIKDSNLVTIEGPKNRIGPNDFVQSGTGAGATTVDNVLQALQVNSIALLRGITGAFDKQQASVSSYYGDNNGGGGQFVWSATSTATDNGGTVIKPTAVSMAGRWLAQPVEIISIRDFGAKGDGSDCLAAMTTAHATGRLVYYQGGDYRPSGNVSFSNGGICGDGVNETYIVSTDASSANIFSYTGNDGAVFKDFQLQTSTVGLKSAGAGIAVLSSAGQMNSYSSFRNVNFLNLPIGIDFVRAQHFKVTDCNFIAPTVAGCRVDNLTNGDSGDSVISSSEFNTPNATGVGIQQNASSGLRILGTKFNGFNYGYLMTWNSAQNGGILVIDGCSFENAATAEIFLARTAGASTFAHVIITNNEMAAAPVAVGTDFSGFLTGMVISGNSVLTSGSQPAAIDLKSVSRINVSGNVLATAATTSYGISADTCTGTIGPNTYANFATAPFRKPNSSIGAELFGGGTVSAPNTTATTAFTIPAVPGLYTVVAYIANTGAIYQAHARVTFDGTNAVITATNGAGMTLTLSGLNVQVNQNSGVTQTVAWQYQGTV